MKVRQPGAARNLLILNCTQTILTLAPLLEKLAARCGQDGAMHWLPYFLDKAVLGRRTPRLVLFLRPEEDEPGSLCSEDIEAAALFFEYEIAGLRTGIFSTADAVGYSSVIAPERMRGQLAAKAAQILLDGGAAVVMTTYEGTEGQTAVAELARRSGVRWASRSRRVARVLTLRPTLDATLAQMGKSTRFNLRYYRRRLEKQLPCEYVADAAPLLRDADLKAINASSLNPVPAEEFARRIASASNLPESFLSGLRGPDGRWLSLTGGWRQGDTTVLYWQMNTAGYEKHSLGTVMRSFLLEDEIRRGSRKLLIYGGTPHSMRHAFREDVIADLVAERLGLRTFAIRAAARLVCRGGLFGRPNFVAELLCNPSLRWHRGSSPARPAAASPLKTLRPQRVA